VFFASHLVFSWMGWVRVGVHGTNARTYEPKKKISLLSGQLLVQNVCIFCLFLSLSATPV